MEDIGLYSFYQLILRFEFQAIANDLNPIDMTRTRCRAANVPAQTWLRTGADLLDNR